MLLVCAIATMQLHSAPAPHSTAQVTGRETELLKLTLSPEAERRLGVAVIETAAGATRAVRSVPGEVVSPAVAGGVPFSSSVDLAALGANQIRAEGEIARLRAQLDGAERTFARADALFRESAGSRRAVDEAQAVLEEVRAAMRAAEAQRALLGPAFTDMGGQDLLWVRAAAFATDLANIDRSAAASIRGLGSNSVAVSARPVKGPLSANPASGTIDLYYSLPPGSKGLQFGQRVAVDLPLRGEVRGLKIPASAIVVDIYGGEWVYVRVAPYSYERRRVEIASMQGGQALVARGLVAGASVVTAGAMELFGAEFGAK